MHIRQQRGFSLVEIMVAMVIALLGTVVIFQVFEISEGIKRTSTSGGDAQQFGAIALFTLERDLRMSGFGINNANLISCTTNYRDASPPHSKLDEVSPSTTLTNSGSLSLVPVEIVPGGNNSTPDEIRIFYGDSQLLSTPAKITSNQSTPFDEVRLANPFGFLPGNAIVIAEPGKSCTMGQVTGVVSESAFYRSGNYTNASGINVAARFNGAPGPVGGYTTNGIVFNLGNAPVRNVYRIKGNQLVLQSMFGTSGSIAIADNILMLKAQYGKDVDGDGSVGPGDYNNTPPANPIEWSRVLTVRLAVLARSAQPEIASSGNKTDACDATTAAPTWSGGSFDLSGDATWQCYRYRVFETTVPLRNLIWQQL